MISPTNILKNFQLYGCTDISFFTFLIFRYSSEIVYITVLLICDRHYAHYPIFGNKTFYTSNMDLCTLIRATLSDIHRKLHHRESVFFQILAKECSIATLCLTCYWQIEEYE